MSTEVPSHWESTCQRLAHLLNHPAMERALSSFAQPVQQVIALVLNIESHSVDVINTHARSQR